GVYLDSAIICDHLTSVPIGLSHNQACAGLVSGPILGFGESPKRVLNVGAGDGYLPPEYYGWVHHKLDIDPDTKPNILCDARDLSPVTEKYDSVLCAHNLEHFTREDGLKVLREFHRVLKPNGQVHIIVPDLGVVDAIRANGGGDDTVVYRCSVGDITCDDMIH